MKRRDWADADTKLRLDDAVAAIIVVDGSDYLLQLRDPLPHIWYPDHWGTFGGAVEPGEDEAAALKRELFEELAFDVTDAARFSTIEFDVPGAGLGKFYRSYWEIHVTRAHAETFVLGEGAEKRVFAPRDVFALPRVTPYDAFALFLHHSKARLGAERKA